jgi:hypothetical protein
LGAEISLCNVDFDEVSGLVVRAKDEKRALELFCEWQGVIKDNVSITQIFEEGNEEIILVDWHNA